MKALKLATLLLSTTTLCGAAIAGGDSYARAAANRMLGASGVTLAGVRADPRRVREVLTGLAAGWGDHRVSVGTLDLPLHKVQSTSSDAAAAVPASGTPASDIAKADDIVVTSGTATIRIRHIEVAGSSLSGTDVAALFATKDPKALEARLRMLDAASIVIPEIDGSSVNGMTEVHFSQKDVLLANVKGGRAATGSAAAATLTFKDDKNDTKVSTGATTFKMLDLAQIVHLATGPRTDDGEPLRPICDEIAIQGSTIGGAIKNGPPVAIATIRETGLKGRPLKAVPGDDGKPNAATLNDIAHSFSADLIEADGFALAGPPSASTNGLKGFALKHVAARGLGDGKLAHFELNGLAMDGNETQPGTLALGSAEIDAVATNATPVPSVDRIDLHDFSIDVPADDKARSTSQRIAVSVAHAGYEAPGLVIGKLPAKATLSIEHATFDVPPDSGAAPMLLAMGYKHLDVSSESRSRYDAAAQTLDLDRLSLVGVGMGALDVKLGLAKVSEGIVSQIDTVQKAATAAVLVKTLDLTLRNDGLIDKAIGFKATIDGVSVEQERTNLEQLIDLGAVGVGLQDSAKAQLLIAALHKFIEDPKTLHIALSSKDGLGADAAQLIGSPQALLDALEVQASADP